MTQWTAIRSAVWCFCVITATNLEVYSSHGQFITMATCHYANSLPITAIPRNLTILHCPSVIILFCFLLVSC